MILAYRRLPDKGSSNNEVEFLEIGVSKNKELKRPNTLIYTNDPKIEYINYSKKYKSNYKKHNNNKRFYLYIFYSL